MTDNRRGKHRIEKGGRRAMAELIRTNRECKDCSKVHMHQEKTTGYEKDSNFEMFTTIPIMIHWEHIYTPVRDKKEISH